MHLRAACALGQRELHALQSCSARAWQTQPLLMQYSAYEEIRKEQNVGCVPFPGGKESLLLLSLLEAVFFYLKKHKTHCSPFPAESSVGSRQAQGFPSALDRSSPRTLLTALAHPVLFPLKSNRAKAKQPRSSPCTAGHSAALLAPLRRGRFPAQQSPGRAPTGSPFGLKKVGGIWAQAGELGQSRL